MVKLTRICVSILAFTLIFSSAIDSSAQTQRGWLMVGVPPSFMNASGLIGSATRLCTTVTGTSTSLATYSDPTLSTALPNPIVLNSIGIPTSNGSTQSSVYGQPGFIYRVTLYANGTGNTCNGTAVGAQIWQRDNIYDSASLNAFANVRLCDRFAGANAGAKIAACLAAMPATGGIADARAFEGAQTVSSLLTIPANVKLLIGAGTYTISTATLGISMGAGSSIECNSPNESILYFSSTATDGIGMNDNTNLVGCTVRGPGDDTHLDGWIGIEFSSGDTVSIVGNIVEEWGGHCINTGGSSSNVNFYANTVRNCHQDGILIPASETNISIKNNWVYNAGSWGIDCGGCKRSIIDGNHVYDNGARFPADGGGITMLAYMHSSAVIQHVTDNLVVNNELENNTLRGIVLVATAGGDAKNNSFIGNVIVGDPAQTNAYGFLVAVGGSTSEITSNIFMGNSATGHTGGTEGSGWFGQYLVNGSFAQNKLIGNRFNDNDYGIVLQVGITDTALEFNDVLGNTTLGISDSAAAGESRNIGNRDVTSNNYTKFTSPLQIDDIYALTANAVTIRSTGNTELRWASSAGGSRSYSAYIDTGGSWKLHDLTSGTDRITLASTGVVGLTHGVTIGTGGVAVNLVLGTSATLNFPSTASLGQSDLTVAWPSISDGYPIVVGITAAQAAATGGMYTAFFSGASTATVRFHNTTGVTVDPGSGQFILTYIQQ